MPEYDQQGITPFFLYEEEPGKPGEVMISGVESGSGEPVGKSRQISHQSTPSESSTDNSRDLIESKRMVIERHQLFPLQKPDL